MSETETAPPPQAVVMQMVMGAWVSQTISSISRLDVPDLIHQQGPLTAAELTAQHGLQAQPEFLERALRACAGLGIFREDAEGRFGPTPLSEVLTSASPFSVKKLAEMFGGSWLKVWTGLPDALRTGQPQAGNQLGDGVLGLLQGESQINGGFRRGHEIEQPQLDAGCAGSLRFL